MTFTAADTVVVRPNSRNGQDVVLGGKVVASTSSATAALRVTWTGTRAWTGRAATVQVTGTGIYRSHSAQAYRYGEMAVTRTGTTLNLVNVLRLGDEYVRGVPESPFYWGPHGAAALQAQALAARTFAYTAYRAGVRSACDCHVYDGTMSQTYDGYRVDQDPNSRYWASAISATRNSVITYQGQPINATYYSGSGGRTMDVHDVWGGTVPYLRSVSDPWSLMRTVSGYPVGNGNVSWTASVSQARMSQVFGYSGAGHGPGHQADDRRQPVPADGHAGLGGEGGQDVHHLRAAAQRLRHQVSVGHRDHRELTAGGARGRHRRRLTPGRR